MTKKPDEPWAAWAEQVQKWMGNPAGINPFATPFSMPGAAMPGFANPFATSGAGANAFDPQAMMKAIDPAEIDRRINDMRAVESWLKLSLSTLEMSIKTMEMQRDA
ncbi:MAG: PhaM family polyhydroxyalkanoate granule multifunctional regulatory protein, partial [Casimicrobium sp.]